MTLVEAAKPDSAELSALLARHPGVRLVDNGGPVQGVRFWQGDWERTLLVGDTTVEARGLLELVDNNPFVCADVASAPSAGVALAMIALGPLLRTGVVVGAPSLLSNVAVDAAELDDHARLLGWSGGIALEVADAQPWLEARANAGLAPGTEQADVDELYSEAFGRSFFVERVGPGNLLPVAPPVARFSMERVGDGIRVTVACHPEGKCGPAGWVQAFDVMCGFEETLGATR